MDLHDFCETWAVLLAAEKLLRSPKKLLDLLKTQRPSSQLCLSRFKIYYTNYCLNLLRFRLLATATGKKILKNVTKGNTKRYTQTVLVLIFLFSFFFFSLQECIIWQSRKCCFEERSAVLSVYLAELTHGWGGKGDRAGRKVLVPECHYCIALASSSSTQQKLSQSTAAVWAVCAIAGHGPVQDFGLRDQPQLELHMQPLLCLEWPGRLFSYPYIF